MTATAVEVAVEAPPAPPVADRRGAALPLAVLALVCLTSLGLRAAWIGTPRAPIFDERYYVGAAERIAGSPPAADGPYADALPGMDPALEHPPLGKLLVAAGIRLLGDGPLGWRAPSLVFGTAALLGLYWLVRAAGGGRWAAVAATAVMAADNLFLVHGRIATLDVFALAFMLAAAALYLSRRPVLAGVVLGVGACTKVVTFFVLVALVLYEVLLADRRPRSLPWRRLAACGAAAAVSFAAVLWVLDLGYTSFGDPVAHVRYMLSSEGDQAGARQLAGVGVAPTSGPGQWLLNRRAITYYGVFAARATPDGPVAGRPSVLFQGRLNPAVALLAVPAVAVAVVLARRRRDRLAALGAAWSTGMLAAFLALSAVHRYNYLYYVLAVLPGYCVAEVVLLSHHRVRVPLRVLAGAAFVLGLVALYPFRTWPGS